MKASYNKLWKLLIDRHMTKEALRTRIKVSPNTIAKMGKDENVSMDVLQRICRELQCDIGDIVEFIPEEETSENVKEGCPLTISNRYS